MQATARGLARTDEWARVCGLWRGVCIRTLLHITLKRTQVPVIATGTIQTSILPKVITPFESKTNSGQFVLRVPNGSIDSEETRTASSVRGESN